MMTNDVLHVIVEQADNAGVPEYALTIIVTVLSGVLVFAISEWLKEIWLTPLQEYKKIRGKVSYMLTVYACYYSNPVDIAETDNKLPDDYENAAKELRKSAAELRAFIETLSWLKIGIPKKEVIYDATANLIGISNGLQTPYKVKDFSRMADHNRQNADTIKNLLKIYGGDHK